MTGGFLSDSDSTCSKMLRFLIVGAAATCLYVVLSSVLVAALPEHKLIISIGVYAAAIPIAFWGQRDFAFRSAGPMVTEFTKYAALQLLAIGISSLLLHRLITDSFFMNLLVFTLTAIAATGVNFLVCHSLIFLPQAHTEDRNRDKRLRIFAWQRSDRK
ncbi:MAG: GtrA family protein [Hyphomicrobium sp.]|uniref:GtrA family protein n=1 Tax=Hyphomicrobium sp. TaxID=82 RepID=UPI0039E25D9B